MRAAIVFTMVLVGAREAVADPLRLADVVAAAVRQAPELARARIDVDVARANANRAVGIEDVHVGATGSYNATKEQSISVVGNDSQQIIGLGVSINRLLSTGGTIALSTGGSRTETTSALDGIPRVGYESTVALSLTQPLLRGAGATTAEAPIRATAQLADAAALAAEGRARDLVVALAQAYWQVALAKAQLEVRQHSLALGKKQQEFTEGQIRSDKVAKSELLAVQQVIAVRQQDVIAAEEAVLERSLELRQLAGLEVGPDAIAVDTEPLPPIATADLDVAKAIATANERSVVLASLAAAERAARTNVDGAEGNARSRLDLAIAGGPIATGNTYGSAVKHVTELSGYSVGASVVFDRAIQRRSELGSVAAARAALEQARIDQRAARTQLAVQATRAVQRARAAAASAALGDRARELAEQNIEAEQHRFELGKSTNFDVLRRQDELEQVRLRQIGFTVDYLSARADLDGLTGEILTRFGVVMP